MCILPNENYVRNTKSIYSYYLLSFSSHLTKSVNVAPSTFFTIRRQERDSGTLQTH